MESTNDETKPQSETVDDEKQTTESEKEKDEDKAENGGVSETEEKPERMETDDEKTPSESIPTHLFRVGWSLEKTGLQLGEEKFSYGYESTGRFVTDKQFTDFATKFGVGDVVTAYVDVTSENVQIAYAVNGVIQGVAVTVSRDEFPVEDFALFPHVLSRNYAFELNFGSNEERWFANPDGFEDYTFLDRAEGLVQGPLRPETRQECEVSLWCVQYQVKGQIC